MGRARLARNREAGEAVSPARFRRSCGENRRCDERGGAPFAFALESRELQISEFRVLAPLPNCGGGRPFPQFYFRVMRANTRLVSSATAPKTAMAV